MQDRTPPSQEFTDVTGDRTLWDLVESGANAHPHRDCLVFLADQERPRDMVTLTWEQTADLVMDMRRRLAALGVGDGRAVVVALSNSPVAIMAWLAIAANGAVMQAVDPDTGVLPLARMTGATNPVLAIAGSGNSRVVAQALAQSGSTARLVVIDEPERILRPGDIEGLSRIAAPGAAHPAMVAGLLPTSGTSGMPKLVELTHSNYVVSGERLARNGGHSRNDRFYLCSPFFHVNAQFYSAMPALVTGGAIALVPRFSASHYFDTARHMSATVSSMVAPPMRMALHRAIERGVRPDPGPLRLIQYGMSMSAADWAQWDRLAPQIEMRQVYGQTESVSAVLGGAPWEADDRKTIGRPFLGVEAVRLVGDDGGPVADGAPGELWVRGRRGRTLMLGYHGDPEATDAAIDAEGWLRTGDLMTRDRNGRFAFVGRRMHIIRRAGENLSIYELEMMMQGCPLIVDVAIKAETDEMLGARIAAHVIPGPGFSEAAFSRWCRDAIGRRGVPDIIKTHTAFPRTGSGRVIVREL